MPIRAAALVLAVLAVFASAVRAQGPVQLTLSGQVDRAGGGRAEVVVTFANATTQGAPASVMFSMFLAERTSAADLAVLLERRFTAAGLSAVNTSAGQSARPATCLFLEGVLSVALRLGHGLRATVTLGEGRPETVRLLPPQDAKKDARLFVTASTWSAHERRHGRFELEHLLGAELPVVRIADQLTSTATRRGWPSDVRNHEVWLPGTSIAGAAIDAAHFDLDSEGDWRLEIGLAPRGQSR
jgi:hypothetical protein